MREVLEGRLGLPLTTSFVVAYSGGRDSHSLLHALHALQAPRLRALHVDHGLQAASREWAEHCGRVCAALHVPCLVERIQIETIGEESTEAAARRLRYRCLAARLEAGDVLLTAHHEDDQAETVLLQLLRGAGAHGLAAMPAIQPLGAGRHARPLLGFSRAALSAYATARNLSWIEDTSNLDTGLSRNFLRAQVLPLLERRWPAAARTIARAASNNADIAALLDEIAAVDYQRCATEDEDISLSALCQLSAPRQRNALRYWIRRRGFHAPSALHLDQLLTQASQPPVSGRACVDWPEAQVHRYRDTLVIRARTRDPDSALELTWQPPLAIDVPGTGWRLRAVEATGEGLSRARVEKASLTVRLRRGGEICRLAGHAHHHKLKKLLQEAGVPPWERERLPLVYVNDELAAIGDRWVCAPFAAKPDEPGWRIVLEPVNPTQRSEDAKNSRRI